METSTQASVNADYLPRNIARRVRREKRHDRRDFRGRPVRPIGTAFKYSAVPTRIPTRASRSRSTRVTGVDQHAFGRQIARQGTRQPLEPRLRRGA